MREIWIAFARQSAVFVCTLFELPMFGATAMAQETLKIAYIDPLSGGGASVGEKGLKIFQFLANELNALSSHRDSKRLL